MQPEPDTVQFRTISIGFETEDDRAIRLNVEPSDFLLVEPAVGQRFPIEYDRADPEKIAQPATNGFFVFQVTCLILGCVTFSPALTLQLFESAIEALGNLVSRLETRRRKR